MTPDQLETLRKLCENYRITFNSRRSSNEWPKAHAGLFADVRTLGNTQYSSYAKSKEIGSSDKPWRARAIDRANRVVEIADKCRRERRNEAGWRHALEPEILSRFTVEVACRKCRARIWRSEIEVTIESNDREGSELEQRRKLRTPCRCPPMSRQQDPNDSGLNPLFSDRAEERIVHEESVRLALARKEHPDRVYGLRQTTNFAKALCSPSSKPIRADGGPVLVNEAIRFTPFKQVGEPLLFPFLILEAKSAKGDDFDSIQKQTAFPIRTLLKIQADLRNECEQRISWQGGPLVWFLYNRGEDWRVAACFVENIDGEESYCIFELWSGVLLSKNAALQLLLIIDLIFDWARDMYRPAILRHLMSLANDDASDTMSISNDSDILSLDNPVGRWINKTQTVIPQNAIDTSEFEDTLDLVRPLRGLDSTKGVFRDASFAESEFLGIHITGDNANTLLMVADTPTKARDFARKLLRALLNQRSILLTEETLNELEDIWTGGASHFDHTMMPATEFVVRLLLKKSLSDDWNQVRELSYLAASQEGLEVLKTRAELKRPCQETGSACAQQDVKDIVRSHLSVPAIRGLRAAIAREALFLEVERTNSYHDGMVSKQLILTKGKKDQAHGLIHKIYRKHKVGMREPAESFIRRSTRNDEQTLEPNDEQTLEPIPPPSATLQLLDKEDPLDSYRNGLIQYILIFGKCVQTSSGSANNAPEVCYYKISGPRDTPNALDVRKALQQILDTSGRIHMTERYARNSLSTNWNLDSFHGIYQPVAEYQRGKIESWVDHLNSWGDCFSCSPPPLANKSKISPPSTPGAGPSKRRVSSGRRQREAQQTRTRNKSQTTPTRRGHGSASRKPNRSPMFVDLTEDDGLEVQADTDHLCKKLCIRSEEATRTGSPSRSTHSESDLTSGGLMPQVPDLIQPEAQTLPSAVEPKIERWAMRLVFQDALARWWGGYTDRHFGTLGNDKANARTLGDATHHDGRDGNSHPEPPMSSTEPHDQVTEYVSSLVTQLEHDFKAHKQHEQDEYQSTVIADALADANLAEDAEILFGVKGLIQNSITNYSVPDYNFERAMTYYLIDPESVDPGAVPAAPILRDFNDANGRWTYTHGDHPHFVRAPQTD